MTQHFLITVRKENEMQTFTPVSSNGDILNGTTTVLTPIDHHGDVGVNSTAVPTMTSSSVVMTKT